MVFDLHVDNDKKAELLKIWIKRAYYVASTLQLSYLEMWELPEQEFLVLEEIAMQILDERKKKQQELKETQINGAR